MCQSAYIERITGSNPVDKWRWNLTLNCIFSISLIIKPGRIYVDKMWQFTLSISLK